MIARARRASAIWGLWRIYKCLFVPKCSRKIMWLLINNIHEKISRCAVETHTYHTIRKNYAVNCAIQGLRLIWKQKVWLAICEFLWSLTNQNAWFVSSFFTELTLFCTVLKKDCTALNQSEWRNFFMYIIKDDKLFVSLLACLFVFFKQVDCCFFLFHCNIKLPFTIIT